MKKHFIIISLLPFFYGNSQVKKEVFESFELQEKRDISLYIPEDYSKENKYPVILILDADYLFDLVVSNAKFYESYHRMPKSIIVGVHQEDYNLRWLDCDFEQSTGLPTERGLSFYRFLEKELLPHIDNTYSTAPFKMFIGYDITANYGNYFLFEEESPFNSYLIISPILATEMEGIIPSRLSTFEQEIFYNLVLEKEKTDDRNRILQMNNAINSITSENIHYFFDEYSEPDHTSIAAYGISKAFDNVFKLFRPISPREYKEQILASEEPTIQYLENKYSMIEDLLGFEKEFELNDIMAIYAGCLKKEDYESLLPLSELCKKQFPQSMMGFYIEGEYLEFIGESKKAMTSFEKAFILDEIDFLTKEKALEKINALKRDFGY